MRLQTFIKTALYKAGYSIKRIRAVPRANHPSFSPREGDVMGFLHKANPYDGFDFQAIAYDPRGWGAQSPAFRELIAETRPGLILEVGSWKGASALEMASIAQDLDLPTRIVCVDTWLGALEFWTDQADPERYLALNLRHGYPTVYYQFLANVCHRGFQDKIIPFPQTASTAALWFRYYGIAADLIYLDGSHEEEDVYRDLGDYWEILSDRGILFGDDYGWDGVRLAVERFAQEEGRQVGFRADKWLIKKSAG